MDERVPRVVGKQDCSDMEYMKDIEEIHYGGSTSEDDEDEPRLTIDTSEDEEDDIDSPLENSSSSSSFSRRRKPSSSSTSRLKNYPIVGRGASATSKINTNPLHSLQQLVHSPFLNAQISVADGGVNQGCKTTPPIKENRSKSNHDAKHMPDNAQSLAAAAEALRNIFSNNNNLSNISGIAAVLVAISVPKVGNRRLNEIIPTFKDCRRYRSKWCLRYRIYYHCRSTRRLRRKRLSKPFADKCDSTGGSARTTNANRLNYIVSKLQRSATEEKTSEAVAAVAVVSGSGEFQNVSTVLKSGQFQARCNNNNLEILPAAATSGGSNMINLTNSKGIRYASSNAQTRPTFDCSSSASLPPPPPLTFKSTPSDFGGNSSAGRMDFRMPPALTMIPKNANGGGSSKKTNCRRSPPPMVPIESIANFRKPLNEDNVVYRLKKLGTDIELEKNSAASRDDQAAVEELVAAASKCVSVTHNNSSNSDKASLPFLKPIPIAERSPNDMKNNALSKLHHPPPPSLIPIKPISQFVPILPSPVTQSSTISEVPIKMKKNSAGRMPPYVSILPKVNVNQNDVLDMAAKMRMNSGSRDLVDGGSMFGKGSTSDVILSCKEDTQGGAGGPPMDFPLHYKRLMAAVAGKVTKKKKRNRLSTKSEYTKLAHALVQAATPLPPKKDDAVIVPIRNEMSPKEFNLCDSEREIITIEPILMPASRGESEEDDEDAPNGYDLPSVQEDEFIDVPDNSSPSIELAQTTPATSSSQQNGSVDDKDCFLFNPSQAIQVGVLPNGRKMLSCDICSGVYHKMFSLKKHYYRNHINPGSSQPSTPICSKCRPSAQPWPRIRKATSQCTGAVSANACSTKNTSSARISPITRR
ncbi:hypothetical protein U1Q18_048360 [Sarracenia purpurea var. burkii]